MGFGKVGSEVARRAKGLGMHVIAHDPYAPPQRTALVQLMWSWGVRIVNVARGGVIDEEALLRALYSGIVAQVLSELAPFVALIEKLGRLAVQ
ncbi:hypothetical protein REPUB_Repub19eG0050000 [Reevesia pubescens]